MPAHDWTRVDAGTFHHFHHSWIEEITRSLNGGLLPDDYYAMAEQRAAGLGPDVVTLELTSKDGNGDGHSEPTHGNGHKDDSPGGVLLAPPKVHLAGETDMEFYRRKQSRIAVRHVGGDFVVAMVEVVSPGNKSGMRAIRSFVEKAAELIDRGIHLLILDLFPPGPRDPQGVHAVIWDDICGQQYRRPAGRPLTLAAYETDLSTKAYVECFGVGDILQDMPLFLRPHAHVPVPLEKTYESAF
ncbi:MAG: DUF4058 family protein, partial [Pirellulaceae bacterium]|nr:DUF4058 family protein [Pirellulaceae bacterium]